MRNEVEKTMVITANVQNKRMAIDGTPTIVCGNSDYALRVTFDEEWGAEQTRTASFVYKRDGKTIRHDVSFTGDEVAVPPVYNTQELMVGFFAGGLRTSTAGRIPCELSIICGTEPPQDPEPTQYEYIMARLAELEERLAQLGA